MNKIFEELKVDIGLVGQTLNNSNVIVRVCGMSARFVDLTAEVQEEFIRRLEVA